jgi:iron complex outermembrane receptor protein
LNRGGLARRYTNESTFTLFEAYATYAKEFDKIDLSVTGGYSFQQDQFQDMFVELGNFPSDALGYNALENSGDRLSGLATLTNISSNASPKNQITAQFARMNLTFDKGIFFNASVRREGSTKLGEDNRFGVFPAAGVGVDVLRYVELGSFNALKFRVGYGVTGSLPGPSGLAQDLYSYSFSGGGNVTKSRDANPDLKWEQKEEINIGLDFGIGSKLTGTLDVYTRNIKDFILERQVDVAVFPSGRRYENAGSLKTNGIELALNYNSIQLGAVQWDPGIVLSSYQTTLEEFIIDKSVRGELGAPGQNGTFMIRTAVGEKIGQIWGPVFDGVEGNGAPRFKDLNGDGTVVAAPGQALADNGDFQELGQGIPSMEFGWTNQLTFKNWDMNAFFRGAVGHSLINNFRAFYEPLDPGAINSYNRIKTDKAVDGLTSAQYSSLYVEKADFFKLDNITLGYNFKTASSAFKNIRVYFNVQNAFIITSYTGIDPEPQLQDFGSADNGAFTGTTPDVLAPGIDRRNSYFNSRTFTFGVNIGL